MSTRQESAPSGFAVGVTAAAGILLIVGGVCQAFQGIVAIAQDDFYVTTQKWVFKFDVTTWGWIHLILGIVVFLAGLALFQGAVWARTVGVILAVVSALIGFAWLPWYPIWGVILVTIAVFVIWALTVHGRDITEGPN